jgi:dTDP-4-amino-4,6-dideoxygalactose transaminase
MTLPRIPLARPWLGEAELEALREVLSSGVLSRGSALSGFEGDFAALTACQAAVGVNSGTAALQIALEAHGVGPGDEVLTVSYTFIGTLNAIARCGATPVLVDIDPMSLNVDPVRLAEAVTPRSRAILVVHLFGRPAPMMPILALAAEHRLAVVEDACEAIGALWQGRPVGGLGDAGCFGFYPNKPVATGEGGMITLRDPDLLIRCRQLRNQGLDPVSNSRHPTRSGLSARLSELHAALGRVQLQRLEASVAARAAVADQYLERLADLDALELPAPAAHGDRLSWFTFPLRVRDPALRDRLRRQLADAGIENGLYFEPAHRLAPYADQELRHSLPVTEDIAGRCLALPLYPELTAADIDRICSAIREGLEACR